ncbi:MAG: nucleoside kinase [Sporomusaceae bacterium]|nr:nucleoside kinase [Sporomusaceae bacterium]
MKHIIFRHGNEQEEYTCPLNLLELSRKKQAGYAAQIVAASVDHTLVALQQDIGESKEISFIDMTQEAGIAVYQRSLAFVLVVAVSEIFPDAHVTIEHAISNGLYCEIHKAEELTAEDVAVLEEKMQEIVAADRPILRSQVPLAEAIAFFTAKGQQEQVKLMKQKNAPFVQIFSCGDVMEYDSSAFVPSTGYLKIFALQFWQPGLIIRHPLAKAPDILPRFVPQPKLSEVFLEAEEWGRIMHCSYVVSLNEQVLEGQAQDLIHVAEALHEKKIAQIADFISAHAHQVKVILIAGPSSSGKTTFAQRLGVQLRVNGLRPVPISLDDYFVERDLTPVDEMGVVDFESLEAIDLALFNKDLADLLAGKAVAVPTFNFFTGLREYNGRILQIEPDQPLIIEGIHGLNERLTQSVARQHKIKIYVSALTQLSIDRHHRVATTDARLLRRIVRDNEFRGHNALRSLQMWSSVRRGEEKNIFPFQERADVMFNSSLIYELAILKKYAVPLLEEISSEAAEYTEARRLLNFLSYFVGIDEDAVPPNSILREFIGGSCFFGKS